MVDPSVICWGFRVQWIKGSLKVPRLIGHNPKLMGHIPSLWLIFVPCLILNLYHLLKSLQHGTLSISCKKQQAKIFQGFLKIIECLHWKKVKGVGAK